MLSITNGETRRMFATIIRRWFRDAGNSTNRLFSCLLSGDVRSINAYMNDITRTSFSSFDVGNKPSDKQPERFCPGFVLRLLVTETDRYCIRSNRESGYGRYDICMYPKEKNLQGIVIEFKVNDKDNGENDLSDTADSDLAQIKDRDYAADLKEAGVKIYWSMDSLLKGRRC